MKNKKLLNALLLVGALALTGCADLVEKLKDDPAIVGGTFTGLKLSLTAIPGVPVPLPEIFIGRGTFYRVGGNRTVEVMAGDAIGGSLNSQNQQSGAAPSASQSEASMTIKAGDLTGNPPAEKPARATIP